MKLIIKTRSQYFLLPFTFVLVTVVAIINYFSIKRIDLAIKTLLSVLLIAFFFLILIPTIVDEVLINFEISGSIPELIYFKSVSIIMGFFIIRKQEKVFKN